MVLPLKIKNGGTNMKTERLNFQWFEREDRRKPLRASLGRDCKLRLGEELRKKVPQTIRIGFDTKNRTPKSS